jgi:hypothetical protein
MQCETMPFDARVQVPLQAQEAHQLLRKQSAMLIAANKNSHRTAAREDVRGRAASHDQCGSTVLGKFSYVASGWRRFPATKRSNSEALRRRGCVVPSRDQPHALPFCGTSAESHRAATLNKEHD